MVFSFQLLIAVLLDLFLGDSSKVPHPVRYIGWLCSRFEDIFRKDVFSFSLKTRGIITFWVTVLSVFASLWIILEILAQINTLFTVSIEVVLLYLSIAAGDLFKHSRTVFTYLSNNDLSGARIAVSMIVGRDTDELSKAEICRGCIESVAENLVDGVTAPVFWIVTSASIASILSYDPLYCSVFGVYFYKSVNTMDSMFGYKNSRYMEFGRFAAKTDDVCNFIPARMSGFFVIFGALILGMNYKQAFRVFKNDRLNSSSPNSGHTEAAASGALGVQLGGSSSYFGVVSKKPLIGKGLRVPGKEDILRTNTLVFAAALLFIGSSILVFNLINYIVI